jgi:hypothetical protein
MNKTNEILVGLICLSIFLQISFVSAWSDDGTLTQNVDGCNELNTTNAVYTLIQNVTITGSCFDINADNITLDCDSYLISNTGSSAIQLYKNYSTVKNCLMNCSVGSYGYAIVSGFDSRFYHTIYNNNIIVYDDYAKGIGGNFKYSNFSNNIINNYGRDGSGISISYSSNNVISNNIITLQGSPFPHTTPFAGINLFYSDNDIFSNNIINALGGYANGIRLRYSVNNDIFLNNTIFCYTGRGIDLSTTSSINNSFLNLSIICTNDIPFSVVYGYNEFIMKDSILNYSSNSENKEIFIYGATGILNFSNVRETDGNCINISCPIGVTCYSDCGSIFIYDENPPMSWEEVDLDENIVDPNNSEQGLLPSIYYGLATFLSNIMTPAIIIIFVIFFVMIIGTIGVIIKKIAMKI